MNGLKIFNLCASLLLGMFVLTACGDDDPLGDPQSPSDIEWTQHEYQVTVSGAPMGEIKWNGYYASIFETWNYRGDKAYKGPRIVMSHYRWFPEKFGPTWWTEKLDNGDWYYDGRYDSHAYETTVSDGKTVMRFDMQGRTWEGILTEGDIELKSTDGTATIGLKRLPVLPYDGSYDDILKKILK